MNRPNLLILIGALASAAALANDRSIPVPAKYSMSWSYLTNSSVVKPERTAGVGFWQRASGAAPGVGANFVAAMEFQLPEAAAGRVRSATLQLGAKPSQCTGAEPVVVDVYAFAGDGKPEIGDASAGAKVATMSAGCSDAGAFSHPIDVTHIVRQTTAVSGLRFVGFNLRKGNHRQGPGLFAITTARLTVVLSDLPVVQPQRPMATGAAPAGAGASQARQPRSSGRAALP